MTTGPSILALIISGINAAAGNAVPQGGDLGGMLQEVDDHDHAVEVAGHQLTDFEGLVVQDLHGDALGVIDEFLSDESGRIVGFVMETQLLPPDREIELVVPLDRIKLVAQTRDSLSTDLTRTDLGALGRWPD